jgi:hypothetical protein
MELILSAAQKEVWLLPDDDSGLCNGYRLVLVTIYYLNQIIAHQFQKKNSRNWFSGEVGIIFV